MKVLGEPGEMRALAEGWRRGDLSVGLVPTMGALHAGHLSLVRRAREECDRVAVSIFVNPLQFGSAADLARYERPLERDRELLEEAGCDALFAPTVEAMYGGSGVAEAQTVVEVGRLGEVLEGAVRPGHFRGVATVVAKLLNVAVPHRAYFGEKDYQQLKVVEGLVRDLLFGVEIVGCPTVREPDGLAMSSRNGRLGPEEREAALALSRALRAAAELARDGETDARGIEGAMLGVLEATPLVEPSYAAVVHAETLERLEALGGAPARALVAAEVGGTHLIDNTPL